MNSKNKYRIFIISMLVIPVILTGISDIIQPVEQNIGTGLLAISFTLLGVLLGFVIFKSRQELKEIMS